MDATDAIVNETPKTVLPRHIAILGLSVVRSEYRPDAFEFKAEDMVFRGFQTNEAPVRYLIHKAHCDQNDIMQIVYLRSDECMNEVVVRRVQDEPVVAEQQPSKPAPFFQRIRELFRKDSVAATAVEKVPQELKSTEVLFKDNVIRYCKEIGATVPEFIAIPYDLNDPSACLDDLVETIGANSLVDVDTTGALRDVVNLITIAIQVVKMQNQCSRSDEGGVKLGRTVYSNFQTHTITSQNETYGLIDLVNAVDAFTRYGKAGSLVNYFSAVDASDDMKELCKEIQLFSDDLSLCRTGSIEDHVTKIHDLLDSLDDTEGRVSCAGELLFRSLIPAIREGFVKRVPSQRASDRVSQLIETVRWCTDREMLQQALAIIDDRTEDILIGRHLILWKSRNSKDNWRRNNRGKNPIVELSLFPNPLQFDNNPKSDTGIIDVDRFAAFRRGLDGQRPRDFSRNDYRNRSFPKNAWNSVVGIWALEKLVEANPFSIPTGDENRKELAAALVWFNYLHIIRNSVMHADEDSGDRVRLLNHTNACIEAYGESFLEIAWKFGIEGQTPNLLKQDLLLALDVLSGGKSVELEPEYIGIVDSITT